MILGTNILGKSLKTGFEKGLEQWFTKKMVQCILELGNRTTNMGMGYIALDVVIQQVMFIRESFMRINRLVMGSINMQVVMSILEIGRRIVKKE